MLDYDSEKEEHKIVGVYAPQNVAEDTDTTPYMTYMSRVKNYNSCPLDKKATARYNKGGRYIKK